MLWGLSAVLFRPRELGDCRETFICSCGDGRPRPSGRLGEATIPTREAKTVASWAVSISFGSVLEVSALKSTVTPLSLAAAHSHYQLTPLSTTFVHILRLTALVSIGNLKVSTREFVS